MSSQRVNAQTQRAADEKLTGENARQLYNAITAAGEVALSVTLDAAEAVARLSYSSR